MFLTLSDIDLQNKRVGIRVDFNVPIQDGKITDESRILAALPTIQYALKQGARVLLWSHLGRPKEGQIETEFSLKPVSEALTRLLGQPVKWVKDWLSGVDIAPGEVVLGENVRFNVGEHANDEVLSKKMATLCDVFVMDAFATAHRAEASTVGVARFSPIAVAGFLLEKEVSALSKAMNHPKRPLVAIVGGSKVSDKFDLLKHLIDKVDVLIVGGGIANTFIASEGHSVGVSLWEPNKLGLAQELFNLAKEHSMILMTPRDVVVAKEIGPDVETRITGIDDIQADEKIGDIGPLTIAACRRYIRHAKTILWNGPLGVFEQTPFSQGTREMGEAIAHSEAYSLAGGGDTGAAIHQYGLMEGISYLSTGGGAFLTALEGQTLPAVHILEERAQGRLIDEKD